MESDICLKKDAGEWGQSGASTPPAFHLGEQEEQKCPL